MERHKSFIAEWLSPCIERDRPAAAAERFYLEFEIGRRDAAILTREQASYAYFQPFADPAILRQIASLDTRFRRDEHLHYNLTKLFAPGLEKLPFESKRWGFEWSAPASEADRAAWLARAPLPVTPRTYGAWPMYGAVGSDCWYRFRDELFCYDDGQNVWSFLNRDALLDTFTSNQIFTPQLGSLFWVIYGLSILITGDWLAASNVPENLVYTRYEHPWGDIYKELCEWAAEADATALDRLTNGIVDWLGRVDGDESPLDPVEPRLLMKLEGDPIREERARYAPGRARKLHLDFFETEGRTCWRVRVDAEPSSPAANSYLVLSLGKIADFRHIDVLVTFRYRAEVSSVARCYLATYTVAGRHDLSGPVLKYEPEWQVFEHVFGNVGKALGSSGILNLEFLLGLPDQANEVEIEDLEIGLRPLQPVLNLSVFVHQIEQQLIAHLRSTIRAIQKRYDLSETETKDLVSRAGIDDVAINPTSEYELWRFKHWLRESWSRDVAPDSIKKRLIAGREHWPLLTLCIGLSEHIRRHLLESCQYGKQSPTPQSPG